jgi:hypothetical protein
MNRRNFLKTTFATVAGSISILSSPKMEYIPCWVQISGPLSDKNYPEKKHWAGLVGYCRGKNEVVCKTLKFGNIISMKAQEYEEGRLVLTGDMRKYRRMTLNKNIIEKDGWVYWKC